MRPMGRLPYFLAVALPNAYFDNSPNRRMRTRMSGGVAGARG